MKRPVPASSCDRHQPLSLARPASTPKVISSFGSTSAKKKYVRRHSYVGIGIAPRTLVAHAQAPNP